MKFIAVKFSAPWQGYSAGEIAGFFPHIASRLVNELGVAVYVEPPKQRRRKGIPRVEK